MSYMKVGKSTMFFFNPYDVSSVRRAFDRAKANGEDVSIFAPAAVSGPWDRLPVIGHRTRTQILADLQTETDPEAIENLYYELDRLAARFAEVGRTLPLQQVAA